ncbi:putative translation initiation factor eIF-2B subunit epsilon [Psilocybe cubensis]|uniref:Translation initiation factor eIF-2B subunit epsilon n=2 Tax=Psilocybe cubensis TaxID=181762 RepID=A0ACB8H931_PSICU|nr:putative translation initiation factor eIF-2B subunit epsilon [Psilocybe cubensis]KAH9484230.1 putative translation initiation factor eIF-2B subunit epsilon [Psilocybe cubensis]
MAAKSTNSGKEKLIDEDEEVLQAVILADSFNKRFRPLTTRKPRCLLPICNAPLLDWTFESLALAGVQEVFVICRSHAELVKNAIKESKWSKPGSGMKIVPIMTAKETFSPGDAMRDIYTRGLVTSDFVLVMGDLVSNIRIDEVVRVHKERRKTNKDAIMTMVVKESGVNHRTRAKGESSVFVLDPNTSECLHYEHLQGYPAKKGISIPREIFAEHPELDIRNDLIDCSIDVCSVEVPSLFQDNFDYLDIRRDFVHGILTSDILMKNIYCYVAEEGYAARVQDTRSYASISKDILSRWTFPLVPDDNHPGGHIYEHTRGNRYIAKDNTVVLARTCNIGTNTLIGSSTTVSDNASVIASVIGQNCSIGAGSTIRNSYIFENAVIGENCHVEQSIIGAGVQIKDGSRVPKGCLIADGVIVGPNATLQPFERLSTKRDENDSNADDDSDDSDVEEVEASQDSIDKSALGKDSNAVVWPRAPPDEEDEVEGPENYENQRFMRLGDTASDVEVEVSDDGSSSDDEESSSSDDDDGDFHERSSVSGMSDASGVEMPAMGLGDAAGLMADAEFRTEVNQSLERAFAEGHSVDNAAVELKTLRMASNVPLSRVKEAVVAAIVEKIPVVDGDPAAQRREIASVVGRWGDLINRIGGVDPVETVSILQAHCATSTRMSLFGQILAALYQEDIVEEDHIRAWHRLAASKGTDLKDGAESENFQKCWMIGSHMIQQFDAQESESEDETESEDDNADNGRTPATPKASSVIPAALAARGATASEDSTESGDESTSTEGVDGGESESASEDVSASENSSRPVSATTSEDETTESESEDDVVLVH